MNCQDPPGQPPPVVNGFTVDLEEWFQGLTSTNRQVERWPHLESRVVGATRQLLRLLRSHGVRATFFVLGHVADHHPGLIEEICADGHEIGVHGYFHRFVYRLTPAQFQEELERGIQAVMSITGEQPLGHRAPYFSIDHRTPWAFACLEACGFRYDSSIFPIRSLLYGSPGAPRFPYRVPGHRLVEFPVSTVRVAGINWPMAGGFYVRALPYPLVRWAIARLNRAGQPAILYLHPWELDTGQVYRQVTWRERITHYHGRQGLAGKLERLFTDFRFTNLGTLWRAQRAQTAGGDTVMAGAIARPSSHGLHP
ncbi:MAG: polysaccharide deacetylase [Litorilinea sp.]|nr:MAG: polysaccharide deacetylase [Litorilinea sp.]